MKRSNQRFFFIYKYIFFGFFFLLLFVYGLRLGHTERIVLYIFARRRAQGFSEMTFCSFFRFY